MKTVHAKLAIWSIFLAPAWGVHTALIFSKPDFNERLIQTFFLGLGYDIMNASILLFWIFVFPVSFLILRYFIFLIGVAYFVFLFIDYHYVLQFGTHLPYSTTEYLSDLSQFGSTALEIILSPSLAGILVLPSILLFVVLKQIRPESSTWKAALKTRLLWLFFLLLSGSASGAYSNSYFEKNIDDPLTSSALNYFFWSQSYEDQEPVAPPRDSMNRLFQEEGNELSSYPLVKRFEPSFCNSVESELCQLEKRKYNIILIVLESFRAAEVGALGTQLGVTPQFDNWATRGVLFNNFYANGFQTRHGEVAIYCSLMPNYGVPIMKSYPKNNFECLPKVLKSSGYSTSWVHGSDSSFDSQYDFLSRNGFDKIIDKFSFPEGAKRLGWGYSDEDSFNQLKAVLKEEPQPFFTSILTITNHHPFEVPSEYSGRAVSDDFKFHESMYYTDAQLGAFLEYAQNETWYENTLIFITADTSNYQKSLKEPLSFEEFVRLRSRVPLLILGGPIHRPEVIEEYSSQIDLAPTITDLLGLSVQSHWVGTSLLKEGAKIAFTNRPGNYWAVMSREGRFYKENDRLNHTFGFEDLSLVKKYETLGEDWIQVNKWLLQENRHWPSDAD